MKSLQQSASHVTRPASALLEVAAKRAPMTAVDLLRSKYLVAIDDAANWPESRRLLLAAVALLAKGDIEGADALQCEAYGALPDYGAAESWLERMNDMSALAVYAMRELVVTQWTAPPPSLPIEIELAQLRENGAQWRASQERARGAKARKH